MLKLLTPPIFGDVEKTQTARSLHIILWTLILSVTILLTALRFTLAEATMRWLWTIGAIDSTCFILLLLTRRGATRWASILLVVALLILITALAATAGGIRAPAMPVYLIIVLIAGLLLGYQASLSAAVAAMLITLAMAIAERLGVHFPSPTNNLPLSLWITSILYLLMVLGLQYLMTSTVQALLRRAQAELTEREYAQLALQQSEAQYRMLFEAAPDGICLADENNHVVLINPALCHMLGYTPEEIVGQLLNQFIAPDDSARLPPRPLDELRLLGSQQHERVLLRKDGARLYTAMSSTFMPDGRFQHIVQDITARKQAEAALAEQSAEVTLLYRGLARLTSGVITDLRELAQHITDILVRDFNCYHGRILLLNEDGTTLTGLVHSGPGGEHIPTIQLDGPGLTAAAARSGEAIYVPDVLQDPRYLQGAAETRSEFVIPLRARLQIIGVLNLEHPEVNAFDERTRRLLVAFAERVGLIIGNAQLYQVAQAEIAERKQIEAALRESEERYRLISTVSSDYMFSSQLGPDGALHPNWVTGAFEKMTGYTLEEHTARGGWLAALHPEDVEQDAQDMAILRTNQPAITEVRTIHRDGSIRWVRVYAQPRWDAENNRLVGIYGAVQDITDRKRAESALRESEELYRHLVEFSPVAITVHSENRIVYINPAGARLWGADSPREVIGRDPMEFVHPDFRPIITQRIHTLQVEDDPPPLLEVRNISLTGQTLYTVGTGIPVMYHGQRAVLSVVLDISERKHAEEAMRVSEARLRAVIENIPFEFWSCDRERRYVLQNAADIRRWGDQMGKRPDDNPTRTVEQKAAWNAKLDRAFAGNTLRYEYAEDYPERVMYVDSLITPIYDSAGQVSGLVGVNMDITERKLAQEASERYAARLKALHEIDRALRAAESVPAIAQAAVDNVRALVNCQRVSMSLFDFQTQQAFLTAISSAVPTHVLSGDFTSMADYGLPIIEFLRHGQPYMIDKVGSDLALTELDEHLLNEGIRSWLYLPLFYQDDLIGSLNLGDGSTVAFTTEQTDIAREVANQLALAIQQSRLLESTRRQVRQLSVLQLVATACVEATHEDTLLERVTTIIGENFFAGSFGVLLVDEIGHNLRVHPTYRGLSEALKAQLIPLGERVVGTVAATGQPRRIDDVHLYPGYIVINPEWQSQLCVPLKIGERVLGVINANSHQLRAFSEADERLLITVAGQLATALERLRSEAALRESERLYRQAIEAAEAVPYYIDHASYTYKFIGRGIERLTGYRATEITPTIWRSLIDERQFFGEAAELSREELNRRIHAGEITTWRTDNRIHTRAGETRWISNSVAEVLGEAGHSIAAIGILQDITERKQTEAELQQLNAQLEQRVLDRTIELQIANEALAKAARLKDEFLAGMSHELRTPLTGILAFSQAMQKQIYGPLTEKQLKALHSIEDSGRHLLELINDVLDLSKIEAGKLELQIGLVLADEICQASLRLVKQMAAAKGMTVNYSLGPVDLRLQADARRLKQMLVNLLSNAIKFTPQGGALGLEVTGDPQAQVVRFTVWDKGIGIASENLSRLFQSFVQLDNRLAREFAGTGLGLALVRRMAEMHGGGVAVESEVGRGSRFTIVLPWPTPPEGALAPELEMLTPALSARPRKALTVEDTPIAAEQITEQLNELGIANVVYPRAEGVIEKVLETRPDVILLDIFLPGESGWNVLARLKADERTQAIPVIIISVMEDRARAAQMGAAEYLVKPIARSDLQTALERVWTQTIGAMPPTPAVLIVVPPAERARILLAEDNEVNLRVLVDYLESSYYEVIVARNGSEAILRARETHPALILMDVQMPGMDGLEATRLMRQDAALAAMPIIAITALAMPGDRERCLAAGASDYLTKPINLELLSEKIVNWLKQTQ